MQSATREAKERADRYPYPLPESTEPDYSHGELHRNMLRKSSCSFAWDWGPCFAPQARPRSPSHRGGAGPLC